MALIDLNEGFDLARLRGSISGKVIGREVIALEQTTSTNDAIFEKAKEGAAEGVVIFAEHQTAGRGQRGNRWHSAAGKGLWFSILLRPGIELSESPRLVDWAARSVAQMIRQKLGLQAFVESPNDIYIENRKLAGVLVEMRAQTGQPHLAIVGIGVNVNHEPDDFPAELRAQATSLAMALGRKIDRESFAGELIQSLDRSYRLQFGA